MAAPFHSRNAFYSSDRSPSLFYTAHQNEVKLSSPALGSLFPILHAVSRTLEMSRVNRGLNKARNPDYFVRIRHSVSGKWVTVYSLSAILREDKERRREREREGDIYIKLAENEMEKRRV